MKKLLFLGLLTLVLSACKANQSKQLDNKTEAGMKGTWNISSVTYTGSDYIKVKSFEIADSQCFVGSTWNFVSNNNKGDVTISKAGCTSFTSPITWYINLEGNYVMKVLNADEKVKKVHSGYVLKLANLTDNSFQLVDKINVGGTVTDVVYQFIKQ
jgi:hypothetical protein